MSDKIHVVCPHCQSANAIIPGKPDPKCGKCGTALLPQLPVHLTDTSFDRYILKTGLPILVDFWAPWCGPCKMMAPAFDQATKTLHGEMVLAKLDTEANQTTAGRFRIQSVPTMALFRHGREIGRISGALNATQIVAWARQQR